MNSCGSTLLHNLKGLPIPMLCSSCLACLSCRIRNVVADVRVWMNVYMFMSAAPLCTDVLCIMSADTYAACRSVMQRSVPLSWPRVHLQLRSALWTP
jgi:hypothetical protein